MKSNSLWRKSVTQELPCLNEMMRYVLLGLFVLACCLTPLTGSDAAEEKPVVRPSPEAPAFACLHEGSVYCFKVKERDSWKKTHAPLRNELWMARLTAEGEPARRRVFALVPVDESVLPRWRISQGCLWVAGRPASTMVWFDRIPLDRLEKPDGNEALFHTWTLEPVYELAQRDLFRLLKETLVEGKTESLPKDDVGFPQSRTLWDAHYDLVPEGKTGLVVLMAWKKEIQVWRGTIFPSDTLEKRDLKWANAVKHVPTEELPKSPLPLENHPVLRVRTEINEPFRAFQDETHYFFATTSGKLYACRCTGDKQKTEFVWNDSQRPIQVVFTDNASNKTYAFTAAPKAPDKDKPAVYFELAAKVQPVPYDPQRLPKAKPDDPLTTMLGYARILLRDKKVQLPK